MIRLIMPWSWGREVEEYLVLSCHLCPGEGIHGSVSPGPIAYV